MDYLRAPRYILSFAVLPFVIHGGKVLAQRWTASPLERCLKRAVPAEFAAEDRGALTALFKQHEEKAALLAQHQTREIETLEGRLAKAAPEARQALLEAPQIQHKRQQAQFAQHRANAVMRACHAAAARSATP